MFEICETHSNFRFKMNTIHCCRRTSKFGSLQISQRQMRFQHIVILEIFMKKKLFERKSYGKEEKKSYNTERNELLFGTICFVQKKYKQPNCL